MEGLADEERFGRVASIGVFPYEQPVMTVGGYGDDSTGIYIYICQYMSYCSSTSINVLRYV